MNTCPQTWYSVTILVWYKFMQILDVFNTYLELNYIVYHAKLVTLYALPALRQKWRG